MRVEKKVALILLENRITTYEAMVAENPELVVAYTSFIEDLKHLRDILSPKSSPHAQAEAKRCAEIDAAKSQCAYCHQEFLPDDRKTILAEPVPLYFHTDNCWRDMWAEKAMIAHNQEQLQKETTTHDDNTE